jgi:hypothetical protein
VPIPETKLRLNKKVRWVLALLSLALALNSTLISADWLSKLKESIGKKDAEQALSTDEVGGGLKEALRVGTDTVVGNLGQKGGFNLDPQIHIPLPKQLDNARSILSTFGMDSMLVELESKLNR